MNNETFITGFGILAFFFFFAAGQSIGLVAVGVFLVVLNMYCAYRYHGKTDAALSLLPLGIFILFIAGGPLDKTLANILMFAWIGSLIYFAMNVGKKETE